MSKPAPLSSIGRLVDRPPGLLLCAGAQLSLPPTTRRPSTSTSTPRSAMTSPDDLLSSSLAPSSTTGGEDGLLSAFSHARQSFALLDRLLGGYDPGRPGADAEDRKVVDSLGAIVRPLPPSLTRWTRW